MGSVDWPAPGKEAYFDVEPALAHIMAIVLALTASHADVPWADVDQLVSRFCGPARTVANGTLNKSFLDGARRNLGSVDVEQAMLAELRALDPNAAAIPVKVQARLPAGWVTPASRKVEPRWVGP